MLIIKTCHRKDDTLEMLYDFGHDDALLLLNDAVLYVATDLSPIKADIFALKSHLNQFGIPEGICAHVHAIDVPRWVQLTEKYHKIFTL